MRVVTESYVFNGRIWVIDRLQDADSIRPYPSYEVWRWMQGPDPRPEPALFEYSEITPQPMEMPDTQLLYMDSNLTLQ